MVFRSAARIGPIQLDVFIPGSIDRFRRQYRAIHLQWCVKLRWAIGSCLRACRIRLGVTQFCAGQAPFDQRVFVYRFRGCAGSYGNRGLVMDCYSCPYWVAGSMTTCGVWSIYQNQSGEVRRPPSNSINHRIIERKLCWKSSRKILSN